MALRCEACGDVGLYKLFWTVKVARGIAATHLFLVPCARCNLPAYSVWLVKAHPMLAELFPCLVAQEAFVAT